MTQVSASELTAALEYARKHDLHALLIAVRDHIVLEEYGGGYDAERPHALYSGTKSFWGVAAGAAAEDGLLDLDEPVADTISAWRDDSRKALVTIRQLLHLTAGIPFGGLGASVPTFDAAIAKPLANEPGTKFTYGGIPLQVFGAVLARKLENRKQSPLDYLSRRIFQPIGLQYASWRALKDGTHTMPTGAMLTARNWLKYGMLLAHRGNWQGQQLIKDAHIEECWKPSPVNKRYGLGFWLTTLANLPFVAYGSGAGKQALYIVPEREIVVVHFSQSNGYQHESFLKRLLDTSLNTKLHDTVGWQPKRIRQRPSEA